MRGSRDACAQPQSPPKKIYGCTWSDGRGSPRTVPRVMGNGSSSSGCGAEEPLRGRNSSPSIKHCCLIGLEQKSCFLVSFPKDRGGDHPRSGSPPTTMPPPMLASPRTHTHARWGSGGSTCAQTPVTPWEPILPQGGWGPLLGCLQGAAPLPPPALSPWKKSFCTHPVGGMEPGMEGEKPLLAPTGSQAGTGAGGEPDPLAVPCWGPLGTPPAEAGNHEIYGLEFPPVLISIPAASSGVCLPRWFIPF